jgi:hypothetical protein
MMIDGCVVPPSSPQALSTTASTNDDPIVANPIERFNDGAVIPTSVI